MKEATRRRGGGAAKARRRRVEIEVGSRLGEARRRQGLARMWRQDEVSCRKGRRGLDEALARKRRGRGGGAVEAQWRKGRIEVGARLGEARRRQGRARRWRRDEVRWRKVGAERGIHGAEAEESRCRGEGRRR